MSLLNLAVRGSTDRLTAADAAVLFDRATESDAALRRATASIISRVRSGGDHALLEMSLEFDSVALSSLEVPRKEWMRALDGLGRELRGALERAAQSLRAAHEADLPRPSTFTTADGVILGRRPDALRRVGVYAPGGRAAYPSSLLMGAIPARVAGVSEVIVCSPPGTDGRPAAVVLAAAAIAGVDHLFAAGGAGAIAAMAFGTATVPRVDRIVGPGNAYVAEAKIQVAGCVGIDSPAGPSELLVLADDAACPEMVAREMLAQAEHDPAAAVVLVGLSEAWVDRVLVALALRLAEEPRAAVIRASLAARGGALVAPSLDDAITFANRWAGEHVLLALAAGTRDDVLARLRNAGTVFLGDAPSVAFGDYMTGANHVLPTGGLARVYSGLSVMDFVRWTTWQRIDVPAAAAMARDTGVLADSEGLPAHARAARLFFREEAS
ncbi:MAG: histidinol dehydrogenase [Gemmatimonadaceae bacterium]